MRYQKQIALSEYGEIGQANLASASVLIIGAGGLGVVVASYLVAMGVGHVGICDFDQVDVSNLHRQFLYTPQDIGKNKATVLAEKLRIQNPEIKIDSFAATFDNKNKLMIASDFQMICDCTDDGFTRMLINNYCAQANKVLVHGAATQWNGYVTVFHHQKGFDLKDIFDFKDYLKSQNCSEIGIHSLVVGMIGSLMANETIKILLKHDAILEGKLLYYDMLTNQYRMVKIQKQRKRML